ncbi:uncharacterized protein DUF3445 [Breoghania corrubedonensis]|uniref:Uncharacterized protein DUF3445 n=1 Tax=Breoghania corrubedonensis TaxID=665038 RepID=A0A2T5V7A9_9HYPH|nr:DUF3445 domain-containing protein [Breoghania corrubedonensis]PTW59620.1 uncharacterized protein DUF3445 [Breoghania corrubedonensis]
MTHARTLFPHMPYDGSKQPFSVGLAPLDLDDWIEIDDRLPAYLAEKTRLFTADETAVFGAEPQTLDAQAEVLALLLDHLPRHFPHLYTVENGAIHIAATGETYRMADFADAPLKLAALLVQEDLVIMRKGRDGYRLVAGALCFPSSWSLREKFGQGMPAIHDNVPGFNNGRMGAIVARIFDNISPGSPVWRLNWSIYGDDDLHHPFAKSLEAQVDQGAHDLFVRVERQTLRRLPRSGDVLFTIRIHVDPFTAFAKHPEGPRLAASLCRQLLALDAAQLDYKGLTKERDRIAATLVDLAGGTGG